MTYILMIVIIVCGNIYCIDTFRHQQTGRHIANGILNIPKCMILTDNVRSSISKSECWVTSNRSIDYFR